MSDQRGHRSRGRGRPRGRGNNNQRPSNPHYSEASNQQSQNNYSERPNPDYRLYESYSLSHDFERVETHPQPSSQHRYSPNHWHHSSSQSSNVRNAFRPEQPSASGFTRGHFRPPGPTPQQTRHHSVPQQQYHVAQENKGKHQNAKHQHFKSQSSIQSEDHNQGNRPEYFKLPHHVQPKFEDRFTRISPKNSEAVIRFPPHNQINLKQNTAQLNTSFDSKHDPAEGNTDQQKKRSRKRNFKPNARISWLNNKKKQQCEPQQQNLFSFSRVSKTSASIVLSEESDDDSASVISTHSSKANDEFVISSDESEESMQSSLFSKKDHVADLNDFEIIERSDVEYAEGITFRKDLPTRESYISVFWDIENCPVPSNKSAIDFVKKVRDLFYEHRTEEEFIVACDTRNLDKMIDRELTEAHVTIIHANSQNKNAADAKLQSFLHKFQVRYRQTNSAIVLISGDSDFAPFLNELRYQNLIFINLICNDQARKSLQLAAQKCVLYTDFIRDLPNRAMEEELFYCLIISNLPDFVKPNAIKANLEEKIKSINGRVKLVSDIEVEIIFLNQTACEKAFRELKGYSIYGTQIDVKMEARSSAKVTAEQDKCKNKKTVTRALSASFGADESSNSREIDKKRNFINHSSEENKQKVIPVKKLPLTEDHSKKTTMYIFVSQYPGNQQYWEKEFKKIFSEKNLVVQWLENDFERYFLVTFLSLSKAQKGKKVLLKRQISDPESPRFVKMIKGADFLNVPVAQTQNLTHVIGKNIEKHIRYIKNKEAKCLEELKKKMKEFKESYDKKNNTSDEQLAFQNKNNEFNEQKITFTYFTEQICKKMKDLSGTEEEVEEKANELMRGYSRECVCLHTGLPIYAKKNAILKKVKAHQVIILQAETGSGKSTQVCQYLWRENFGENGMIICTQPRKIAAISIANYVSSQIGCTVGGIVGYQVGLSKRRSDSTKILYVTDFTMLKMCSEKSLFEGISCIMIDEAHERSVYTDLLLGMVKQAIKFRPDLRVIITSATIQCSLFQNYFSLPDSAIYQVPGRSFPIEDIWFKEDVTLGWDYLSKTVKLTYQILQEATGNILAFLTTPLETEKASEQLQEMLLKGSCKFDVCVLQLHGKLDINEQRKVFEKTKPNVRKVVFSTNCAETSVTIPGITYVVDCGMVKEAQYDAVRNLNILSVGFTNKSSSEQRRGRAGRTQSGKCFRLYSKANYENNMVDSMVPEILRTNLGQALLKLMLLGIKDPNQFDFIESPSPDSMHAAVKQLVYLGAVNRSDMSLTYLGQQMSALPLEPRLCYVIFKAIEKGIGYDAVVIAALATVSRNIFFRNSENSKEADVKKIRFCQSESDFFTFLEIYKEWATIPKTEKTRWCVRNCINARSMHLVHDLVNELILTLSKEFNSNLPNKFSQHENFVELMHELICFSFSENICVFSGHPKLGYRSFDVPENLYIHPSSSLYSLGTYRPQYIVYDAILKTSRPFLINITAVKESAFENIANNDLMKTTLDCLKSMALTPYIFCRLGDLVLKTLLGKKASKLKMLEMELKNAINSEYFATEVDFSGGKLSIFIPSVHYSQVKNIFLPHIEKIKSNLFSWEKELHELTELPNLVAVVGAGMEIKEILLPGDFRDVIITPADCNFTRVMEDLRTCGDIRFVREGKKYHKVIFKNVVSAKNAVKMFDNNENVEVKPPNIPAYGGSLPFFKIFVHLSRRPCAGRAFFNVKPSSSFSEASYCLSTKYVLYHGAPLKITLSRKVADDFCLSNLPEIVNKEELISILNANLPPGIQVDKLIIILKPEFKSEDAEIELIRNKIIQMFTPFTLSKKLHIDLKSPKPKDRGWQAVVYFENPQDGQIAVNVLKSRKSFMSDIERSVLTLNPLLETSLVCHKHVFSAIKEQINDAVQYFNRDTALNDKLEIQAKLKDDGINVLIQISSNNIADINDARRRLFTLIQGDQIPCLGKPQLEKLFTTKGQLFVTNLVTKMPESYINIDERNKILSLFGSEASCTFLKSNLNSFLDDVEKENYEVIHLKLRNSPKSILKEVITKYGFDLSGLQTECTLSSAEINVYKHTLTISGKRKSVEQCKTIISNMQSDLATDVDQNSMPVEECPVCCSETDAVSHRLEYCGHLYCKVCLLLQIKSGNSFPICCCKKGCNQPFVLEDIHWAINAGQLKKKELYSKAFKNFMTGTKDFKYCPTPDCLMVYRLTYGEEYSEFCCPECGNNICTRCCILYHAGMSCGFYQSFKVDDNHSLQVWLNADPENHKLCPSCKSPIEKNGGCTHMTCWKCKCHMCWRCMKTFPSGDDVYSHQASCPVMLRAMYND